MKKLSAVFAGCVLVLLTAFPGRALAQATNAANKVHVSASTMDVFGPTGPVTVLSTSMKTSANADLILSVTAECAIAIDDNDTPGAFSSGQFTDFALAVVRVSVAVDGVAVPVAVGDDGKITFCRREYSDSTFRPGGFTEDHFEATRAANSFNWFAKNVGAGTHSIEVKAEVLQAATSSPAPFTSFGGFTIGNPTPVVQGVVGRRTLVVEPVSPGK